MNINTSKSPCPKVTMEATGISIFLIIQTSDYFVLFFSFQQSRLKGYFFARLVLSSISFLFMHPSSLELAVLIIN